MADRITRMWLGIITLLLLALLVRSFLEPGPLRPGAWRSTAPMGTWVKGADVLSFNPDGTYLRGYNTGSNDYAYLGEWKRMGSGVLELSDPGMQGLRFTWKLSEDGNALFLTTELGEAAGSLFGRGEVAVVYTRR